MEEIVFSFPDAKKFIRKFYSADDFLNSIVRYCTWIDDNQINEAKKIIPINERIKKCYEFRVTAGRDAKKGQKVPHRFFL